MIVADTSALLALLDAGDTHHASMLDLYDIDPGAWVLPWAILPELDYLLTSHVSPRAAEAFLADLAAGSFSVEWGDDQNLRRAEEIARRYASLRLGLVDAAVIAIAERHNARAIATLDIRHFGAVEIKGSPLLLPRDAGGSVAGAASKGAPGKPRASRRRA